MPPSPTVELHGPFLVRSPSGEVRIGTLADLRAAMATTFRGQPVEIFELSSGRYIAASALREVGTSAVRRSSEAPAPAEPTPPAAPLARLAVPPATAARTATGPADPPSRPAAPPGRSSESSSGWPVVAAPPADSWSVPIEVLPPAPARPGGAGGQERTGSGSGAARRLSDAGGRGTGGDTARSATGTGSDRSTVGTSSARRAAAEAAGRDDGQPRGGTSSARRAAAARDDSGPFAGSGQAATPAGAPTGQPATQEPYRRAGLGPSDPLTSTTARTRRQAGEAPGPSIVVGASARPTGNTARLTASAKAPASAPKRPSVSGRASSTQHQPSSRLHPAWVRELEAGRSGAGGDQDDEDGEAPAGSRAVRVVTVLGIVLAVAGAVLFWARQSGMFAPDMMATLAPPRAAATAPAPSPAAGGGAGSASPAAALQPAPVAAPPGAPSTQGLQLWLPFTTGGQPGADASGHRVRTKVDGAVQVVDDAQRRGVATFDGHGSIAVANPLHGAFTVACWLRTTQDLVVPDADADHAGWYQGIGLIDGEVPNSVTDFGLSLIEGRCAFGSGAPDTTLLSRGRVNDGAWHHVAAVRDARGTLTLYLDGHRDGSRPGAPEPRDATKRLTIGCIQTGVNHFIGKLDEVRIYDRALDEVEVATLVAAERVVKP